MTAASKAYGHDSYVQWVREAMHRARDSGQPIVTLFDSSVPEPTELLRQTVARGFAGALTPHYKSAFTNGNPFVIDRLAERYGVATDRILCTTGATGALSIIYRTMLSSGDRILVERPGFDLFHSLAEHQGIGVDYFDRRAPAFAIDADHIASRIGPRTRLVILSNLHNPSGMLIDAATMERLAAVGDRHDVLFIFDEVYGDYADISGKPLAAAQISPRFVSISSLTKIFGLSTLRCGWIVGDAQVVSHIRGISQELEFGISTLAHSVAALVLEDPAPFMENTNGIIQEARPLIERYYEDWRREGLMEGVLPQYGCISFPRLLGVANSEDFANWLADNFGVMVAPGEYFGAPGYVRIGHGHPAAHLEKGLEGLTKGLRLYRENGIGKRMAGSASSA